MAIGLNSNDMADLAVKQENKITELENKYKSLEDRLLALEKGEPITPGLVANQDAPINTQTVVEKAKSREDEYFEGMPSELDATVMEEAFVYMENQYKANGVSIKDHPGLFKLFYDPIFKAEVIKKAQDNYKIAYEQYIEIQKNKF